MSHYGHVVAQGLGDPAGTLIDPQIQIVGSRAVCLVSCKRSPAPVYLKWKGREKTEAGDFFVRIGAQTKALAPADVEGYVRGRF